MRAGSGPGDNGAGRSGRRSGGRAMTQDETTTGGTWGLGRRPPLGYRRQCPLPAPGEAAALAFLPRLRLGIAKAPALARLPSAPPASRQLCSAARGALPAGRTPGPRRAPGPTSPPGRRAPHAARGSSQPSRVPAPPRGRVRRVRPTPIPKGLQVCAERLRGVPRGGCCAPFSEKPVIETDPGALLTRPWTYLCPSSEGCACSS